MMTRFSRMLVAVCVLAFTMNAAAAAMQPADDFWDAWESANKMLNMIKMGEKSGAKSAGADAVNSLEKAIDKQESSSKKDKWRDAKAAINKAIGYASDEQWPYAEGEAKKAIELLESSKP